MRKYIVCYLCLLFVGWSMYPTLYELVNRDKLRPERYFELVHNFYTDYNFYLSRIRQGIEGRTTVVEKYTSEPHSGSFIQVFYLALGWAGGWTRTPWHRSGDVYHVARAVLGVTLIFLIGAYAKRTFPSIRFQVIAFLLAVTATSWATLTYHANTWRYAGYMGWWTVMDNLQRITHVPHLLAGQSLVIFLIAAHAHPKVFARPKNWIFLGVLGFLLGIIFPPGLVFVYAVFAVLAILEFVGREHPRQRVSLWIRERVLPRVIFIAISIPALLYLALMLSFYPWKQLALQDVARPLSFNYKEYFLAVGPILPVGLVGLLFALIRKEKVLFSSVAWVIAWLVFLGIFRFIPQQSPLRFSEMLPHVPLGVLSAYLFYKIYLWSHSGNALVRDACGFTRFIVHSLSFIVPITLIAFGLGNMYSSWLWQKEGIDTKGIAAYPFVPRGAYVIYPLKDQIDAIRSIQDTTSRDTVVLSDITFGNYTPVYSGNTVYIGHPNNTVDVERKQEEVREFYSGRMGKDIAYEWVARHAIDVVVYGPQEREHGGPNELTRAYPFLQKTYENTYFEIYRVQ